MKFFQIENNSIKEKNFWIIFVLNDLANDERKGIGIHENIQYNQNGEIYGVEYVYEELNEITNEIKRYHAILKKDDYQNMIKHLQKSSFPFETFIQIFRPFIMGKYAIESIDQAFALLDQDKSGNIDITELSSFIPLIRNDANPHQIIDYIQKKRF